MSFSSQFQNVFQMLQHSANRREDALALAFEGERYTYGQLNRRVHSVMEQLRTNWSLSAGARIVLAYGNTPAFCEIFFAAMGLGIEVVPFSTKLKEEEGLRLIQHVSPNAIFYNGDGQNWLSGISNTLTVSLEQWHSLTLPERLSSALPEVVRDDTAVIMFTSGTTGTPKGVVITQSNLLSAITAYKDGLQLDENDSTVLAVPVYHITGLSALLSLFIALGGAIWLQERFQADAVLNTVIQENITFLHGSPTVFILLSQAVKAKNISAPLSFPSLRQIACGAGHLNAGLIKELTSCFPHAAIHPVYGLTETTSPATLFTNDIRHHPRTGSSGKAIQGLEIDIRDDQNERQLRNEIGQIWLRGDVVVKRYWQPPHHRPACDEQGWFATGDLGYLDNDGYLFIKDRSKDMINRGGEKIYSIDLENLISTYSGVKEVAVIPAPSPIYGEEPVAFIVTDRDCHLTRDELLHWLRSKVAKYQLPVRIIFTRFLPRTHNGKICKRELKTQLQDYLLTSGNQS